MVYNTWGDMTGRFAKRRLTGSTFRLAFLGAMLSTVASTHVVLAQDAAAPAVDEGTQLQEIVVTAQKRSQNVQDTPVSVTAYSAEILGSAGLSNATQLAQIDPALNISFNADTAYPFIRGIGNIAAGVIGNEASVATYIDNVYNARLFSALLNLGDVERVEVLKGPQGTLFGRNASGGAIQIVTKEPGRNSEFKVTLGYANYNTISGQLYAAMPVTDTLSWSIAAGGYDQKSGWGHSLIDGTDVYLGSSVTVRSKLIWTPTDSTKAKLIGYFARSEDDFGNVHDILSGTYQGAVPGGATTIGSLADSGHFFDSRAISKSTPTGNVLKTYGVSLEIDQDVGFGDVVSITAYRNSTGDAKNEVALAIPGYLQLPIHTTDRQFSQELQIKSHSNSAISWILGGYYFHYLSGYDPYQITGTFIEGVFGTPGASQTVSGLQTIDSYSAFGQVTAPIFEGTNVTVGARYSVDDLKGRGKQFFTVPSGTVGAPPTIIPAQPSGIADPYTNQKSFNSFTWRVALDHHFSKDLMVYASNSRGFKAGTYNTAGLVAPPAKPEVVTAYELGIKSELFDRRVRLNGALFLNDIKNPQVQSAQQVGAGIAIGLVNAEKAKTKGVEFNAEVLATKGLKLRANVVYLDAVFKKFLQAPVYTGGLTQGTTLTGPTFVDVSGTRMVNAPKWRITGGGNYSIDAGAGTFVADVNIAYTSRYTWTIQNVVFQKPMALVNASLAFTPASMDNLTVKLWGKNLGNVKYNNWVQESAFPGGAGGYQRDAAAPLTFGGEVSVKF